jgi:hypothetical protein
MKRIHEMRIKKLMYAKMEDFIKLREKYNKLFQFILQRFLDCTDYSKQNDMITPDGEFGRS